MKVLGCLWKFLICASKLWIYDRCLVERNLCLVPGSSQYICSIWGLKSVNDAEFFWKSLASWALFYCHKVYCYTFWPNLDKFFSEGHETWLFVEERFNISRISDTYKNSFICILLKHRYIPHINNLLLIPDSFVRPMMMCL